MPAMPDQSKAMAPPVVIEVQEIFGVHEHIDICRRLALEGYRPIAPELYFRRRRSE